MTAPGFLRGSRARQADHLCKVDGMKELTELEALQAKYDALKTEYHLIRATLRLCLSDEQNVANPGSVEKIRALAHDRDTSDERLTA